LNTTYTGLAIFRQYKYVTPMEFYTSLVIVFYKYITPNRETRLEFKEPESSFCEKKSRRDEILVAIITEANHSSVGAI